jgi:hypothetical protein
MSRVLAALLLVLGLAPATLHAAPAPSYGVVDARTDVARSYVGARYAEILRGRFRRLWERGQVTCRGEIRLLWSAEPSLHWFTQQRPGVFGDVARSGTRMEP